MLSRRSIDCLKEHYRTDVKKEEWELIIELKPYFGLWFQSTLFKPLSINFFTIYPNLSHKQNIKQKINFYLFN